MEVDIRVKDAGMALMCSMSPAFRWQAGSADVSVSLRGSLRSPQLAGTAAISRGSLYCPYTKYPLTNVGALVKLADDALQVRAASPPPPAPLGLQSVAAMSCNHLLQSGLLFQCKQSRWLISTVRVRCSNTLWPGNLVRPNVCRELL